MYLDGLERIRKAHKVPSGPHKVSVSPMKTEFFDSLGNTMATLKGSNLE